MKRFFVRFNPNSSSGVPLLALGVIALGAGAYHRSAACASLGFVLVALPALVYLLLRHSARRLRVTREIPPGAFEGEEVNVRVALTNGSRLPIFFPRVSDIFEPALREQKDLVYALRVRPGETVEERYTAPCDLPRGVYRVGPLAVSVSDPFGWFQARQILPAPVPFKVYPQYQEVTARDDEGSRSRPTVEELVRAAMGDSHEFLSVREYRRGDPLRRVHWGLTAHRGFPVVREYARHTIGDLHVFLDLYRLALLGVGRGSSLEQSVRLAVSLAARALRRGFRVRVSARGSRDVDVEANPATAGLQAILDALVGVRADGGQKLDAFLEESERKVRPGSTVIAMVSPYLTESEAFERQVHTLRRRGVRWVLVVFDDSTFLSLYEHQRGGAAAEAYVARMRAAGVEARLFRFGSSVADVLPGGASSTPKPAADAPVGTGVEAS